MMPTREPRAYDTDVACGSGRRVNESEVNSEVPLVHADRRRIAYATIVLCACTCAARPTLEPRPVESRLAR